MAFLNTRTCIDVLCSFHTRLVRQQHLRSPGNTIPGKKDQDIFFVKPTKRSHWKRKIITEGQNKTSSCLSRL